jgi:phage/plasmid primase-like uncharacterized protein
MMNAQALARALGGVVSGRDHVLVPGPNHGPKDRSLAVKITGDDDFKVHSFAGDDWQDCRDYVRQRAGLPEWQPGSGRQTSSWPPERTAQTPKADTPPPEPEDWKVKHVSRTWAASQSIKGTLAETYLKKRGLVLLPDVLRADALRFHPNCSVRYGGRGECLPAMTAAIRSNHSGDLQGVHCTFLDRDGTKAAMPDEGPSRRIYGNAKCGSVRLIHNAEICDGIGIAEGIETALAVMCMGWLPVWSVLSIPGLHSFAALFDCVTIWGDNDAEANGNPGQKAAIAAVDSLRAEGCEAVARLPAKTGSKSDWNDSIQDCAA